eukprot:5702388-Ditylum_brightwellii.AAC.1
MNIAKDFSREAIQFAVTKKPPIAFKNEADTDQKIGENRTYKFHTQPEEDNLSMYSLTFEVFEWVSPNE